MSPVKTPILTSPRGAAGRRASASIFLRLHANSDFGAMQLVHGTEPFKPNLVEAILGA